MTQGNLCRNIIEQVMSKELFDMASLSVKAVCIICVNKVNIITQ